MADPNSEGFVAQAAQFSRALPAAVQAEVREFRAHSHPSGAALIRGLPIGRLSPTPLEPTAPSSKDRTSERTLLAVATMLGEPAGYQPELGGRIVQNLVPTRAGSDRQISTSSSVQLLFHTETAFHPFRPAYLLLLCLRGDPCAATTLASIREIMGDLSARTLEVLFQPRFRIGIDESFLNGKENVLGPRIPVLSGDPAAPTLVFDEDLMVGTDAEAATALVELGQAAARRHARVTLQSGDLLIIDNARAVHGRSPYKPRFDGSDRWLQRTFVVERLPTRARDLDGRVIKTEFGREAARAVA
jgi:L-asparagine oxygenase